MTIVTAEVTRNPAWATGASLAFAGGVTALGNMYGSEDCRIQDNFSCSVTLSMVLIDTSLAPIGLMACALAYWALAYPVACSLCPAIPHLRRGDRPLSAWSDD